jgi:hypothetical protein
MTHGQKIEERVEKKAADKANRETKNNQGRINERQDSDSRKGNTKQTLTYHTRVTQTHTHTHSTHTHAHTLTHKRIYKYIHMCSAVICVHGNGTYAGKSERDTARRYMQKGPVVSSHLLTFSKDSRTIREI